MLLLTSVLLLHLCSPALGTERPAQPDRHRAARPVCAHPAAESPGTTTPPLMGRPTAAPSTSPVHPRPVHPAVSTAAPAVPLPAVTPAPTPDTPDSQRAGNPTPGVPDAARYLRLARSPRTTGAAGAAPHTATDARANAVAPERSARDEHPSGIPRGAEPALPAQDTGALQAFRC